MKNISISCYSVYSNSFNSNNLVEYKFFVYTVKCQNSSISNNPVCSLRVKTVLFQAIQYSISTQFSFIKPIDKSLSDVTTPSQSGPGNDGNEGVLRIPQSSSITGTSLPDCLVSYTGHLFGGGVLPHCRGSVGVFYSPSRLGKLICVNLHIHAFGSFFHYIYIYIYISEYCIGKSSFV